MSKTNKNYKDLQSRIDDLVKGTESEKAQANALNTVKQKFGDSFENWYVHHQSSAMDSKLSEVDQVMFKTMDSIYLETIDKHLSQQKTQSFQERIDRLKGDITDRKKSQKNKQAKSTLGKDRASDSVKRSTSSSKVQTKSKTHKATAHKQRLQQRREDNRKGIADNIAKMNAAIERTQKIITSDKRHIPHIQESPGGLAAAWQKHF